MAESGSLSGTVDEVFRSVTKQLTGLVVLPGQKEPSGGELWSLLADAAGDYSAQFTLCAEKGFLLDVAHRMKRVPPITSEEEAVCFLREYFNMVCGRVVSAINNRRGCAARIGMVSLVSGSGRANGDADSLLCANRYESACGHAVFRVAYRMPGDEG